MTIHKCKYSATKGLFVWTVCGLWISRWRMLKQWRFITCKNCRRMRKPIIHKLSYPLVMRVADCSVDVEGKTNFHRTWQGVTCKNCLRKRRDA